MSATAPKVDLMNREFQLEELEDKETAATSVVLAPDGTIAFGATDGPLPKSITGTWMLNSDGEFRMVVTREFEASYVYEVTRTFQGVIDEVMEATQTVIVAGEMFMNDAPVGFFKMISAPNDIQDSVEKLDKQVYI